MAGSVRDELQLLTGMAGLDVAAGLKSLRGRTDSYLRLLRKFATGHREDMRQLRQLLDDGDRDSAQRNAHSLKGASGTLGATAIQALAAKLEGAIRGAADAPTIAMLIDALEVELGTLAGRLEAVPETVPDSLPVDLAQTHAVLTELETLLVDDDMRSNGVFERNRSLILTALGPHAEEIGRHLAGFHYDRALATLRQARAALPAPV
jgi:two-component system sensor histidine kinase/response regulator